MPIILKTDKDAIKAGRKFLAGKNGHNNDEVCFAIGQGIIMRQYIEEHNGNIAQVICRYNEIETDNVKAALNELQKFPHIFIIFTIHN